jgi:branched-chain amino acid transport system substrate-binding protein
MKKGRWYFVMLVLLLTLPLTTIFIAASKVVSEASPTTKTLRVGALFPQTGSLAFGAANAIQGVTLAVEMYNQRNPHGIRVELVTADAPDPAGGTSAVRHLITQERVDVVIGTYSSAIAAAAAPAAERLNIPYLETTAFAERITRMTKNVLRTTISSGALGAAAADFILTGLARQLGVEESALRVAILFTDDEFGTSIADAALARFQRSRARLVLRESYPAATTSDLSSVLMRIQREQPHAVIHVAQVADAVLFWRQAQQLNVNIPAVIGTGGGYGQVEFARPLGPNADGIFNVVPPTSGSINTASLSPAAQALLRDLRALVAQRGWTQGPYTDWAFIGTWVFLNEVVPRAKSFSIADIEAAAIQVRIEARDSITGFGFEFAGPDHPNSGQNLRAVPVVQQWQGGTLRVTYPADFAVAKFVNVPLPPWAQRPHLIGR